MDRLIKSFLVFIRRRRNRANERKDVIVTTFVLTGHQSMIETLRKMG